MKIILVIGTLRSGKTLLARALSTNPQTEILKEPYFFYFKQCRNIFFREFFPTLYNPESPMETDFMKGAAIKDAFKNELPQLQFTKEDIEIFIKLTHKQQENELGERGPKILPYLEKLKPGSAASLFEQLMNIIIEAYGNSETAAVGFSEGWCEEFIEPMLDSFGFDINIIQTIRDPRAVYSSRNKSPRLLEEYGGTYPMLFIVRNWRKSIAYHFHNQKKKKYLGVKYEDVVSKPEKIFKLLCQNIGINFSPTMLDTEKYSTGAGQQWQRNSNYNTSRKGITSSSVEKWKETLTQKEQQALEFFCEFEMKLMDYSLLCKTNDLSLIQNFTEDESKQVEWIKKFNYSLSPENLEFEIVRHFLLKNQNLITETAKRELFISDSFASALKTLN